MKSRPLVTVVIILALLLNLNSTLFAISHEDKNCSELFNSLTPNIQKAFYRFPKLKLEYEKRVLSWKGKTLWGGSLNKAPIHIKERYSQGPVLDINSPELVIVYRGVNVTKDKFDPNYSFQEESANYVTIDLNIAIQYGTTAKNKLREPGVVVMYQMPAFLLSYGRLDGSYKIDFEKLRDLEIDDLSLFILKLGQVVSNKDITWSQF
jgi:hypothetical protein